MRFLRKGREPGDVPEAEESELAPALDDATEEEALAESEKADTARHDHERGGLLSWGVHRKRKGGEDTEGKTSHIIAITNQKGGVGKSTTAVNLGAYMAMEGKRTLLIDLDPQGNATSGLGVERKQISRCIYNALVGEVEIGEISLRTEVDGLWMVPSTINLAGAEIELVAAMSRESRLKNVLLPIAERYDYIFVDCPPSLGLLTINALTAAEEVLIPIQCEFYALEGLVLLMRTIQQVKAHLNPSLQINGILMTMYDARTNLSKQVVEEVVKLYPEKMYKSIIPRSIRLSEAPSFGRPIALYDGPSKGAIAYHELAKEVIANG